MSKELATVKPVRQFEDVALVARESTVKLEQCMGDMPHAKAIILLDLLRVIDRSFEAELQRRKGLYSS